VGRPGTSVATSGNMTKPIVLTPDQLRRVTHGGNGGVASGWRGTNSQETGGRLGPDGVWHPFG